MFEKVLNKTLKSTKRKLMTKSWDIDIQTFNDIKSNLLQIKCSSSYPEVFCKKVFLEISQNSQENTCARAFFNKVAGLRPPALLKKKLRHRCFPVNFVKFRRTLFYRTPLVAASICTHFRKKSEVPSKDHLHMPRKIVRLE